MIIIHIHKQFTTIKKAFRPLGLNAGILKQGKDSEGDLVFSFRDACIE